MPYRTLDNVIDGVVITFTDTTAVRALERAAREQVDQLRQMADSLPHLVFGARADGASPAEPPPRTLKPRGLAEKRGLAYKGSKGAP